MSNKTFKFGGPSTPSGSGSSSNSQVSYSGSFVSSVSPSDSVSNAGSGAGSAAGAGALVPSLAALQINPVGAAAGGSTAGGGGGGGGGNGGIPNYYDGDTWKFSRLDYATFSAEMKSPMYFVAGPVIKANHLNGKYQDMKSEFHMQYLHVVDSHLSTLEDATSKEKTDAILALNNHLFGYSKTIITQWGRAEFFVAFRDLIAKPVIDAIYNGVLDDIFFKPSKEAPIEPLSKAVFQYWLNN